MGTIREKIEEEYNKKLRENEKNKEIYIKDEVFLTIKEQIVDAYYAKKDSKHKMIKAPILAIIFSTIGGIIEMTVSTTVPGLLIELPFIGLDIFLYLSILWNGYKFDKNKKILKEGQEKIAKDFPEYGTGLLINKFALEYDQERHKDFANKIASDQKYIDALNDALTSDDLIERIEHYYQQYEEFKYILIREWDSYLEYLSNMPIEYFHIPEKDDLKEVKTIRLNLEKSRDKSHNLAIK